MQTENLPNNNHKKFLCYLNTNTYRDMLKENNLNLKGYY